jgi:hypothetical protein
VLTVPVSRYRGPMANPIRDIAPIQTHKNAHSGTLDTTTNVDEHMSTSRAHISPLCYLVYADRFAHSRIRTYLNSLSPINRLPPEILTKVFTAFICLDHSYRHNGDGQWVRLVNVCRHWRSLITGTPTLWRFPLFVNAEIAATMLTLSRQSPLVIKAQDVDSPDAVELALFHLSRIEILHIAGRDTSSFERFLSLMNQPAPLLESLSLHYVTLGPESSGITLPSTLLGTVTPRLRHVSIFKLDVAWDSPLLSGLSHLEILGSTIKPSPTTFCNVLSRCPALHTLILSITLPIASEQRGGSRNPVSLPQLSKLEMSGDLLDCVLAARCISFPPTTYVRISSTGTPPAGLLVELPPLLSYLWAERGGSFSISILNVEIFSFQCCLRAYSELCVTNCQPGFPEPLLDLMLDDNASSGLLPAIFHAIPLAQLRQLRSLSITLGDHLPAVQQTSWATILGCCEKLRHLTVGIRDVGSLLSSLKAIPGDEAGPSARWGMSLPDLRRLSLKGAHFGNKQAIGDLRTWLMLRRENRNAIEWLDLIYCDDTYRYACEVHELEQYVVGGVHLCER